MQKLSLQGPNRPTIGSGLRSTASLVCLMILGLSVMAWAQGGPSRASARGEHGGTIAETASYRFEVIFRGDGLWIYPSAKDGKPITPAMLAGTVTFYHPNSPQPWFTRPLRALDPSSPLGVAMGLSRVPARGATATFEVTGLADPRETSARFTVPVALSPPPTPSAPAAVVVSRATAADQAAINAQRTCAVSGGPLGSMGTPVKITRGGRSVFLCCQSCVKRVLANPDRYLGPRSS